MTDNPTGCSPRPLQDHSTNLQISCANGPHYLMAWQSWRPMRDIFSTQHCWRGRKNFMRVLKSRHENLGIADFCLQNILCEIRYENKIPSCRFFTNQRLFHLLPWISNATRSILLHTWAHLNIGVLNHRWRKCWIRSLWSLPNFDVVDAISGYKIFEMQTLENLSAVCR